jgi:hypothetical protein
VRTSKIRKERKRKRTSSLNLTHAVQGDPPEHFALRLRRKEVSFLVVWFERVGKSGSAPFALPASALSVGASLAGSSVHDESCEAV